MKLVYVAGCGRSGSTLLDAKLGARPGVLGAGELANLFEWAARGLPCECSAPVVNCELWGPVLANTLQSWTFEEADRITRRCESSGSLSDEYRRLWSPVLEHLDKTLGCSILVDSSKTTKSTRRRAELLGDLGYKAGVLHLMRQPRDVISSITWASNRKLQGIEATHQKNPWKVAVSWVSATYWALRSTRSLGAEHLVVRFEDVTKQWGVVEEEVWHRMGWDANELSGPDLQNHGIAGNRARHMGHRPEPRPQTRGHRLAVAAASLPLRPIRYLLAVRYGMSSGTGS